MSAGWLDDLAKRWGAHMRRTRTGWPTRNIIDRLRREGASGAVVRSAVVVVPLDEMAADVRLFHRAWLGLSEVQKATVFVTYAIRARWAIKAEVLGRSKSSYYRHRDAALRVIEQRLENSRLVRRGREFGNILSTIVTESSL